jgi:DeoR family transcriptional regulator of aga operon
MKVGLPLSNIERQEALLHYIQQEARVTVTELSDYFGVSAATVRRDLDVLEARGDVARFHGGAMVVQQAPPELPVLQRSEEQTAEKARIGRAAADLIQDGDTVFLGSGTTVLEVAKCLRQRKELTIITNSVLVVNELAGQDGATVVSLGGMVRPSEMSMIGHMTEQALGEVRAQKIFMGIRAIDVEHGLTNDYLPETMTDRAILNQSGEIIIVADHSKCGRVSTAFLASLDAIDILITDVNAPDDLLAACQQAGARVILA